MKKVYLAGGLKTKWRDEVKHNCPHFIFYNPAANVNMDSEDLYTTWDLLAIKDSDILFAYMEAFNPFGQGMSLEIGYARALGKTIIFVDESNAELRRYFGMARACSDIVVGDVLSGMKALNYFS